MKLLKLILPALVAMIFVSCKDETARYTPYTREAYNIEGNVKCITEKYLDSRYRLYYTKNICFDKQGRMTLQQLISGNDTVPI